MAPEAPLVGVVGETLPLGLGIALNPIAIVVCILILTSAGARINGFAFTIGWGLGLTVLLMATALFIQSRAVADPHETRRAVALAKIAIGGILILASVRELWRSSAGGKERQSPRWMNLLDRVGVLQSLALGLFLAVVSVKNLMLLAAAASFIGQASLNRWRLVSTAAIFVVICTIGILIPLLVHVFGGEKADFLLASWRTWLGLHAGAITAVVMILLGAHLAVEGIGAMS